MQKKQGGLPQKQQETLSQDTFFIFDKTLVERAEGWLVSIWDWYTVCGWGNWISVKQGTGNGKMASEVEIAAEKYILLTSEVG